MKQRLFVAVALDDELRHGLAAHLAAGTKGPLPGTRVPPENWHITLRFIGPTHPERLDRLLHELDTCDLGEAFRLGFDGLGAFPHPAKATVLWLGVARGSDRLEELAGSVESSVVGAGFVQEERPFHPHLTLSRIRPQQDVASLVTDFPRFPLETQIAAVTLYRSVLGGNRPARYEIVEEFALRARRSSRNRRGGAGSGPGGPR